MEADGEQDSFYGRPLELFAPAKVNLCLEIAGRRSDGYHLLEMLNLTVDFGDTITVELNSASSDISLTVCGAIEGLKSPGIADVNKNLACRAARQYLKRRGLSAGVAISLDKSIPMGSGLGGGSSNAAAVLRGLERLCIETFGSGLGSDELLRLAVELGADVPFLLAGGLARVSGIGEKIRELDPRCITDLPIALVLPGVHSDTGRAFKSYQFSPGEGGCSGKSALFDVDQSFQKGDPSTCWQSIKRALSNDLQETVVRLLPELKMVFDQLTRIPGVITSLSGSGAAIFVVPDVEYVENFSGATEIIKLVQHSLEEVPGIELRVTRPYLATSEIQLLKPR